MIQVIGLGAQDDFALAQDFISRTGTETPTMLWDPSLTTWIDYGVRINSQMLVASADLATMSDLFRGFGDDQQAAILEALPSLTN